MTGGIFEATAVASVILRCENLGQALEWYRDKLGWGPISTGAEGGERFATFSVAGLILSLWELPAGQPPARVALRGTHVVIYVHDDVDAVRRRLLDRDVDVESMIEAEHYRCFRFSDPDGNLFEVTTARGEPPEVAALLS